MYILKALLKWIVILFLCSLSLLIAAIFLLPEPYSVNISPGDFLGGETPDAGTVDARFQLPDNFSINLYADHLPNVRVMKTTSSGGLVISQPKKGKVVLLGKDKNGDGRSDSQQTIIENLDSPHGLALHKNWLYIAETNAVGRIVFNQETGQTQGEYQRLITDIPANGNHWTRTIGFGPDGRLYLSIGSSCNVCNEESSLRATISSYREDGSDRRIEARGLRNSVGFDWDRKGRLYATENGRDLLGDNTPPDELNEIKRGSFYGWPIAYGDNKPDPEYGKNNSARVSTSILPAHKFAAHNAPLGIKFIQKNAIPGLKDSALVALHGSWNRSKKDGYEVVRLIWNNDRIIERPFLTGFEKDGNVIGRPAFVEEGLNGEIFVSDDYSGVIYRIIWKG